ncbi:MAG: hypothetical protein ACE5HJ_08075 [Thermoplasmata archaeon]
MCLGSFFVIDSGESHGGWEYIATYAAELTVRDSSGTLTLTLQEDPGDVLDKHRCQVTSFQDLGTELRMDIDGHCTCLPPVADDQVRDGKFSGYYIAAYGPSSPPSEIIEEIAPEAFLGLAPSFYVELRLGGPGVWRVWHIPR